ncbi:HNH endonuclease [Microbulbifer hainanensis]|uniref:HNH endonuclease n=1 Tax=Microbulbifer hainanensis TaxID=2735675 RepID=UPI001865EFAB|nr:HNH endonuclease signature motif containing protein [Microbulbifer hainanensis]
MFFPSLTRKPEEEYHNSKGVFYSDYNKNREKIEEDCQHRCVYCDILATEMGGEGMQLDHFRPQAHFPELKSHPHNLVLACPKCNRFKSDDWPADPKSKNTYENNIGYIDYFSVSIDQYLEVDDKGLVSPKSPPINYIIKRMHLNRKSRVVVRQSRIILKKFEELSAEITTQLKELYIEMKSKTIAYDCATDRLEKLVALQEKLGSMRNQKFEGK